MKHQQGKITKGGHIACQKGCTVEHLPQNQRHGKLDRQWDSAHGTRSWHGVGNTSQVTALGQIIASSLSLDINEISMKLDRGMQDIGEWEHNKHNKWPHRAATLTYFG